jgi:hypothetical protein
MLTGSTETKEGDFNGRRIVLPKLDTKGSHFLCRISDVLGSIDIHDSGR